MESQRRIGDRDDRGQIIILFALFQFVLIAALAIALDVGYLLSERRNAQAAADAGALAGAVRWMSGDSEAAASSDVFEYVSANGVNLSAEGDGTAVVSLDGTSSSGTVTVDVTVPVTRFFIGAVYTGDWEVSAHAVAEINDLKDGQFAMIALEEPGMALSGAPQVRVIGGGAYSNGGIERSGQDNGFYVDTTLEAHGVVNEGNLWTTGTGDDGFIDNQPVMPDPLRNTPPPPTPLDSDAINPADHPEMAPCLPGYEGPLRDCVLYPGYYKNLGRLTIKGTATLMPGLYYFEGTAIYLQGDASRITDDDQGVMLYFAEGSSVTTTYFDPANSSGGVHLTAPSSSPYPGGLNGMTLWIDNCSDFEARGSGEFYIEGVFYAPCSYVYLHGNPYGDTISGQVIVGTLDIRGEADFIVRHHAYVETPVLRVYLIE